VVKESDVVKKSDLGKELDAGKNSGAAQNLDAGKDTLTGFQPKIFPDVSAIENFLELHKHAKSCRKTIPLSPRENGFVSFSERESLVLFLSRPVLEKRIRSWSKDDYSTKPSVDDLLDWLNDKESGYLINRLLADVVPKNLTKRQRGKAGYRGAIKPRSTKSGPIRGLTRRRPLTHASTSKKGMLFPGRFGLMDIAYNSWPSSSRDYSPYGTDDCRRSNCLHISRRPLVGSITL